MEFDSGVQGWNASAPSEDEMIHSSRNRLLHESATRTREIISQCRNRLQLPPGSTSFELLEDDMKLLEHYVDNFGYNIFDRPIYMTLCKTFAGP